RVETYFVPARPSWESHIALKERIRAVLIADPALVSGRVDIAVFAGHVVLVGVVNSQARVQKFISDARSVTGVVDVPSYRQTACKSSRSPSAVLRACAVYRSDERRGIGFIDDFPLQRRGPL